jgi:hypothetical protein
MRLIAYVLAVFVLFCLADTSVAQDRSTPTAAPAAKAAGLRLLTWPGKVAQAPQAAPAPVPARRPIEPQRAPEPTPAALPSSIYDPPPAKAATAAAPAAQLAQAPAYPSARFYSLHRAYGQAPDPVSLSPQFLASASPDLADPPPPPPRQVTTASGRVERVAPPTE